MRQIPKGRLKFFFIPFKILAVSEKVNYSLSEKLSPIEDLPFTLRFYRQKNCDPGFETMSETDKPITQMLFEIKNGEQESLKELLPLVYDELRRLAKSHLRYE